MTLTEAIVDPSVEPLTHVPSVTPARGIELLEPEPRWKRYVYGTIALLLAIGFFFAVMCYWVPVHSGTDQNGYLVGGKMFAQTLTMRFSPIHPGSRSEFDPHQFVGKMWVGAGLGTPDERYYPKYPIGLPALYAVMLWIGSIFGPSWGPWLVYLLSPIAMSLAVLGCYLLARRFAGSFGGLLATLVFATSPVALQLAINPNSHAAAVCSVVWGMYFLIGWWQLRGAMRAIAAGFLLGYAATIRYSEATLILPIGLVALFAFRWRDWKSLSQSIALLAAWAVPVGLLVLYNHFAIGDLTGYDPTNESTGFGWSYAADNWETMLRQINTNGLAQLFPLALAGMVWMFWWNWRAASVLAAWIVPCLLIYTFYYWAPDGTSIGYLRFFTTILPGLAMCFYWLMSRLNRWAARGDVGSGFPTLSIGIAILAGVLVTLSAALLMEHYWLADHDPTEAGVHRNWLVDHITPAPDATEADFQTPRVARIEFDANRFGSIAAGAAAALIALALARGRIIVPAVGAGLFTGVVIAMHLTNAVPALEADQNTRFQLDLKTQAICDSVPDGSVIILPNSEDLLNTVQFFRDYDLYDGRSFRRDWVQNLPNAQPATDPQGLDPGRRDALYKRLKDFSQIQLDEQARGIMHDALAANRRVFFVMSLPYSDAMARRLRGPLGFLGLDKTARFPDPVMRLCPSSRFNTVFVSVWPSYLQTPAPPKINKPRGLKPDRLPDPLANRLAIELIEVKPLAPNSSKG